MWSKVCGIWFEIYQYMSDNSLTTNDLLIQSMIPVLEFVNFEISFICMLRIPMQR